MVLARGLERADRNSDGRLDAREFEGLVRMMRERLGNNPPPGAPNPERIVTNMLERLDTNKDGKISKAEARGPLADNFDRADADKDGSLDKDELKRLAPQLARLMGGGPGAFAGGPGRPTAPDFDAFDKNADGRLTVEELKDTPYATAFADIDTGKDGKIDPKGSPRTSKSERKSPINNTVPPAAPR
jgi:Ca2+-binding EF-hand superfamily protein